MRLHELGLGALAFLFACSPSPGSNDAGSDASPNDAAASDATKDAATSDAPSADAGASGTGTVTGTINGKPVDVQSVVALKGVYDSSYPGIVTIMMANVPNMCGVAQEIVAGNHKANLFLFGFALGETTADSVVTVGSYGQGQSGEIDSAGWDSYDATCTDTNASIQSGTVTLTSVDPYIGTFDLTFANNDHVTGSFNAPLCSVSTDAGTGNGQCLP